MKKLILFISMFLALPLLANAQSTTVSGTVTDSGSQSWNNGTFVFQFAPNPLFPNPAQYTWTGGTLNLTISGTLDGSGAYSQSIPSNSSISPQGSKWQVQFCPAATSGCYVTANTTITGPTQTLNATPPAISINLSSSPQGSFTRAYSDSEITTAPIGGQYYNLTSAVLRICNAVSGSACTSWSTAGGGATAFSAITASANTNAGTFSASGNSWDFTGTTIFKLRVGAGATASANGDFAFDSTSNNWHGWNGADRIFAPLATGFVSGHCGQPTSTAGKWEVVDAGTACGSSSFTNPMTTSGDLIVGGASGAATRLAVNATSVPQNVTSVSGATSLQPVGVVPRASTCPSNADTILPTDRAGLVTWSDALACAVTLPQAGSAGFASNFVLIGCNIGAGTVTITPTTSTISFTTGSAYTSGATSIALTTGQCLWLYSDNTNYTGIRR